MHENGVFVTGSMPLCHCRCCTPFAHVRARIGFKKKMGVTHSHTHTLRIFLQLNKSFSRAPNPENNSETKKEEKNASKCILLLRRYGLLLSFCVSCGRVASTKRIELERLSCIIRLCVSVCERVEHSTFENRKDVDNSLTVISVQFQARWRSMKHKRDTAHTEICVKIIIY